MPSQVCHKREAEGDLTDRSRGGNVKTEVETGVTWPQAKECQQPLATGRGREWVLPLNLWNKCGPDNTWTSDFCPLEP